MAYLAIEDFKLGLDRRRPQASLPPGSLWTLTNAHITRGGDIEKRKAFVSKYTLPANTFGMAAIGDALYVFGSAAASGIPAGVTYQRLQHPDGFAMTGVEDVAVFAGKLYVTASFTGGSILHFYDGAVVNQWLDGTVRASMTDNDGIAAHLTAVIDRDSDYTVSAVGAVITITGEAGDAFDISATAINGAGGTDDQTAVVAITVPAIPNVVAVAATTSFSVTDGSPNIKATGTVTLDTGASGSVDTITVDSVDILGGAVAYNTSLSQTATDVAAAINSHTSDPEYTAVAVGTTITISAAVAAGADPNTFAVVSGATTITTTDGNMAGGVTNAITSILVDGVEILDERVAWTVSHSGTATNLAAEITSAVSSPEYTATAEAALVTIAAAVAGTAANGKGVVVTTVGSVTVSATIDDMAGGVAAAAGQAQTSTVTIGGTFEAGDQFAIIIDEIVFGADRVSGKQAAPLLVLQNKVNTAYQTTWGFSAVGDPLGWGINDIGAGFKDMSSEASGQDDLTAFGIYQQNIAIFSRRTTQIWFVDPDPGLNVQLQVIPNLGTISPKSVISYGDADLFFLAGSGIRSLRVRNSSNTAGVSDIGTPIDPLLIAAQQALTTADIAAAAGTMEPYDDRYWLALGDKIYVFSFFPGSQISAWSIYEPGFTVTEFAVIDRSLYARAGNTIYLYGGDSGVVYDASPVTVETPFFNGKTIATWKKFEGFDVGVEGEWTVRMGTDPNNPTLDEIIAIVRQVTYGLGDIGLLGTAPMFKLKFTHAIAEYASISSLAIHYQTQKPG